jgi:hypothetical protein
MFRKFGVASTFFGLVLLTGCAGHYYVGASYGPPAPIVEGPYGVAPGPDFIWVPGFYDWDGGSWAWRHGGWRRRPHPRDQWVPPRWEHQRNGYRRTGGGWQHGNHFHH